MIEVTCAMQQDKIKDLLESYEETETRYVFKEKKGIKLLFEVTGDPQAAATLAKNLIKGQPWGSVLYLQVAAV